MRSRKLFWKLEYKSPAWCNSKLAVHYAPDQVRGILYAGITIFGHSIIYTDYYIGRTSK